MSRFVVTGTGRCGTKWAATALRTAGILCGHEQVFTTDMLPQAQSPRWGAFEGDSSLAAVPYMLTPGIARRVLLVRHPLGFAGSLLRVGPLLAGSQPDGLTRYLKARHPHVFDTDRETTAALRYWTVWNRQAADHADVVLRIEEVTVADLLVAVERTPRWPTYPVDPTNVGPNGDDLRWGVQDPETAIDARNLAREFGYNL